MTCRAKPKHPEKLDKLWNDWIDDEGYIHGWYVDGYIVGNILLSDEGHVLPEYWWLVDKDSVEVVE